ncbi:MAG: hypothetical protein LIO46_03885 [Clostridiales bacterium]|nr:hypothetical protein [Clostridiales bacterium]
MTSTTSFSNFLAEYRWNLKKSRLPLAIMTAVNALFVLGVYLLCYSMNRDLTGLLSTVPTTDITNSLYFANLNLIWYLLFGFFMVLGQFNFLFSKRKLDFYHALPVQRSTFLLARFATVLTGFILSTAVQALLIALLKPFFTGRNVSYQTGPLILSSIAVCLTAAAMVSILILCAVSSGRLINYIMFSLGLCFLLPIGVQMIVGVPAQHVSGLVLSRTFVGCLMTFAIFGYVMINIVYFLMQCIAMLAVSALCLWAGCRIYRRKKSESAENDASSRVPVGLTQLALQLICMSFLSVLMGWLLVSGNVTLKGLREMPFVAVLVSSLIGLGATLLAELILNRSRRYKRAVFQWSAVTVVGLVFALFLQTGWLGYEDRIPAAADVDSVVLEEVESTNPQQAGLAIALFNEVFYGGGYVYDSDNVDQIELTGQDAIQAVIDLHTFSNEFYHARQTRGTYSRLKLTYKLSDGRTVSRTVEFSTSTFTNDEAESYYWVDYDYETENKLSAFYYALAALEEYQVQGNRIFRMDLADLAYGEYDGAQLPEGLEEQLLEAVKQDFMDEAAQGGSYNNYSSSELQFYYFREEIGPDVRREVLDKLANPEETQEYEDWLWDMLYYYSDKIFNRIYVSVPSYYANTLKFLGEQGVANEFAELDAIRSEENLEMYFMPLAKWDDPEETYYDYRSGDWGYEDYEIDTLFSEYGNVINMFWYPFAHSGEAEFVEALLNAVQPDRDQKQAFLDDGDGYVVVFALPKGDGTYKCTRTFYVEKKSVPDNLERVYQMANNSYYY